MKQSDLASSEKGPCYMWASNSLGLSPKDLQPFAHTSTHLEQSELLDTESELKMILRIQNSITPESSSRGGRGISVPHTMPSSEGYTESKHPHMMVI